MMKMREGENNKPPKTQVMHKAISHRPLTDALPSPKESAPPNQLPPAQRKIQQGSSIVCQCRKRQKTLVYFPFFSERLVSLK